MHVFRQNLSRFHQFFYFCNDKIGSHGHHNIEIACIAPVKQIAEQRSVVPVCFLLLSKQLPALVHLFKSIIDHFCSREENVMMR